MTSQPGVPGMQPDPSRDSVNQDPRAVEHEGNPGNGTVVPWPKGTGAAGDSAQRPPTHGSLRPADTPSSGNGSQARATAHGPRSTGRRADPPQNAGGGSPRSGTAPAQGDGTQPGGTQPGGAQRIPPTAGRQRRLSWRATEDRAVAAQEAAVSRRAVAAAADLLWTRPPAKPTRYWLPTRLTDMGHGWLDGRRGLPRMPEVTAPSPPSESAPTGGTAETPFLVHAVQTVPDAQAPPAVEEAPAATVPVTPPSWLQTPRMRVLWGQARELIRAEEEACIRDCSAYERELRQFQKARDAVEKQHEQALAELARAQRPLTDPELSTRRLAEQSPRDRPDSLVRARRQTGWERRLARAAQKANAVTAQLADATRESELREGLSRDRKAVARTAALRHYEFYMRRTATYLQQLVRTHKQGTDLNMLLMRYPVGPELPEWTRNPPTSDETSSQ